MFIMTWGKITQMCSYSKHLKCAFLLLESEIWHRAHVADLFFKTEENQSMTLSSAENSLKPLLTKQKKRRGGGGGGRMSCGLTAQSGMNLQCYSEEYSLIINKLIITLNLTPN